MNSDQTPPPIHTRAFDSFYDQGMMHTLKAKMVLCHEGKCHITAPIRSETSQQHGFGHAGLAFSIGDSACGYAALSLQDANTEVLTSEMKIHLLAPAAGDHLIARAEVVRAGRRLIVTRSDVFAVAKDGKETMIATLLGTIVPVAVKPA